MESFVTREGLCALPYIRVLCGFSSAGSALDRMEKAKTIINARMTEISNDFRANASRSTTLAQEIEYWSSSGPYDALARQRESLLPTFRSYVDYQLSSRYGQQGIPIRQAIDTVLAALGDK